MLIFCRKDNNTPSGKIQYMIFCRLIIFFGCPVRVKVVGYGLLFLVVGFGFWLGYLFSLTSSIRKALSTKNQKPTTQNQEIFQDMKEYQQEEHVAKSAFHR